MARQGLATIGIEVQINEEELRYVTEISDIGGTPSTLDVTCFKDSVKRSIPGVQDNGTFEVTYLFDNTAADSNYRKMKTVQDAGRQVPIKVHLPDGTEFSALGYVSTYVTGAKVDDLVTAKLVVNLQSSWDVENPIGG